MGRVSVFGWHIPGAMRAAVFILMMGISGICGTGIAAAIAADVTPPANAVAPQSAPAIPALRFTVVSMPSFFMPVWGSVVVDAQNIRFVPVDDPSRAFSIARTQIAKIERSGVPLGHDYIAITTKNGSVYRIGQLAPTPDDPNPHHAPATEPDGLYAALENFDIAYAQAPHAPAPAAASATAPARVQATNAVAPVNNPLAAADTTPTTMAQNTVSGSDAIEIEYWRSIKESKDPADFEAYLKKFPNGHFTDLAWRQLDALRAVSNPPPTSGATVPAPLASAIAGKRVAIKVVSQCPSDPDPLGLLPGNDSYSDCAQDELNKLRDWITTSLTSKGVFGQISDDNPDFILTVTLTQSMSTEGAAGFATDLAPSTLEFTATYQLTDAGGRPVNNGTVHHEDAEDYFGGNEDAVEQAFAGKIAAAVAANATGGMAPASVGPPAGNTSPQPVKTLASPPPPDDKKECTSMFCPAGP